MELQLVPVRTPCPQRLSADRGHAVRIFSSKIWNPFLLVCTHTPRKNHLANPVDQIRLLFSSLRSREACTLPSSWIQLSCPLQPRGCDTQALVLAKAINVGHGRAEKSVWKGYRLFACLFWLYPVLVAAQRRSLVVVLGLSCTKACGILVPQPGIEPKSPASEVDS